MQGRTMQNKQAKYSNNSVICSVFPTFIWKLFNKFFCAVTFKKCTDLVSEFDRRP